MANSSSKEEQVGTKKAAQDSHSNQSVSIDFPSTINLTVSGNLELKSKNEHADSSKHFYESHEFWLVVFTALLVAVTARLVFFTKKLWGATDRLVEDAKETSKRELRAYLWTRPDNRVVIPTIDAIGDIGLTLRLTNDGKTPAYEVRHIIGFDVFEDPHKATIKDFSLIGSNFVLNPGADSEVKAGIGRQFSDAEKTAIVTGASKLYVFGEIRYKDTFGDKHWTKFRLELHGKAFMWSNDGNEAT